MDGRVFLKDSHLDDEGRKVLVLWHRPTMLMQQALAIPGVPDADVYATLLMQLQAGIEAMRGESPP
jgi:hypothetical protein